MVKENVWGWPDSILYYTYLPSIGRLSELYGGPRDSPAWLLQHLVFIERLGLRARKLLLLYVFGQIEDFESSRTASTISARILAVLA